LEQTIVASITIDRSDHNEVNRTALGSVHGGRWITLLRGRRLRNFDPDWHGSMMVVLSDYHWDSVPYNTAYTFLVQTDSSHHPKIQDTNHLIAIRTLFFAEWELKNAIFTIPRQDHIL
jgi:hypothetical protein